MARHNYSFLLILRIAPIIAQTFFLAMLLSLKGPDFTGAIAFFLAGSSVMRGISPFGLDLEILRVSSRTISAGGFLSRQLLSDGLRLIMVLGTFFTGFVSVLSVLLETPENTLFAVALSALPCCAVSVLVAYLRPSKLVLGAQTIEAFGTTLLPTIICSVLLHFDLLNTWFTVLTFISSTIFSAFLLLFLSVSQSRSFVHSEGIDGRVLRSNGVTQSVVALNSRLPTMATGFFSTPTLVSYVDLGSKMQLVGSTVAWLFGVFQSPIYARDGEHLSRVSLKLIFQSAKVAALIVLVCGLGVIFSGYYVTKFLAIDLLTFLPIVTVFTAVALIDSLSVAAGYAFTMVKKGIVVLNSAGIQLLISFFGIMFAGSNLSVIFLALLIGSLARFAYIFVSLLKERRNAS